jgi:hypothetical protein
MESLIATPFSWGWSLSVMLSTGHPSLVQTVGWLWLVHQFVFVDILLMDLLMDPVKAWEVEAPDVCGREEIGSTFKFSKFTRYFYSKRDFDSFSRAPAGPGLFLTLELAVLSDCKYTQGREPSAQHCHWWECNEACQATQSAPTTLMMHTFLPTRTSSKQTSNKMFFYDHSNSSICNESC